MQGTFSVNVAYEIAVEKLESWKTFCIEHGLNASYEIVKHSFCNKDYCDISYTLDGIYFIGEYNYATHTYYGDELSAEELNFVKHSKFCAICNSSRNRLAMSVVRINGALATVGLNCKESFTCKYYFHKNNVVDINAERQEHVSHYQYSITDMLRFVNQYTRTYATYTQCREYANAALHCKCIASEFFKAFETFNISTEPVETIEQLIAELESATQNEYLEKIYLMLKDAQAIDGVFHDKSVAMMLSYLYNRKLTLAYADANNAEQVTDKNTSMTLIGATFMPSKYDLDGKIKYIFKTVDNTIVVWYSTSFTYSDSIGKTFTANLSKAELVSEKDRVVLKAKRLRLK